MGAFVKDARFEVVEEATEASVAQPLPGTASVVHSASSVHAVTNSFSRPGVTIHLPDV
jgi:hypothetical protein